MLFGRKHKYQIHAWVMTYLKVPLLPLNFLKVTHIPNPVQISVGLTHIHQTEVRVFQPGFQKLMHLTSTFLYNGPYFSVFPFYFREYSATE